MRGSDPLEAKQSEGFDATRPAILQPEERRVIRSEELLQGQPEVLIQHGSEFYLLRITRNGRLLLTK